MFLRGRGHVPEGLDLQEQQLVRIDLDEQRQGHEESRTDHSISGYVIA